MHLIALEQQPTSLRGGQELNLFEICRGLAQQGHQISLLYAKEGNLLPQYREFCAHTIRVNRYGFDRRKVGDILDFLPSLAGMFQIPTHENSLVFCNAYHTVFFGYLLSIFNQLPLVCYLQIPPFDFNRQRMLGLRHVHQFVAVSHYTRQEWGAAGFPTDKMAVVHNGTDPHRFQPVASREALRQRWQIPSGQRVICYAGRIDAEKGLEVLIQGFAAMVHQGVAAQLLIAGKPIVHVDPITMKESPEVGQQYQRSLVHLAQRLGVGDAVRFLGHVSDTAALYQASDLTVVPSIWPEPFGRVVIESMACGTPVIASQIGGIPEILTGEFQAGLFEPGNPQALADRLWKLSHWQYTDPQLGDRCRQHVLAHFTLERMVADMAATLLKVTHQSLVPVAS